MDTPPRYHAAKLNGRMVVIDDSTGEVAYVHQPFLVPMVGRGAIEALAREMSSAVAPIVAIMAYETLHNRRARSATGRRILAEEFDLETVSSAVNP